MSKRTESPTGIQAFVNSAQACLTEQIPDLSSRFSPDAGIGLFSRLKTELSRLFTPTFRAIAQTARFREFSEAERDDAAREWLNGGGFDEILRDFPLLRGALDYAVKRFVYNTAEYLTAVKKLGVITQIAPYASDLHNEARSAIIFSTEKGKYVYKPRPANTDNSLTAFLHALVDLGAPHLPAAAFPLETSNTVVPFIENTPAKTRADIEEYYTRSGALLALVEMFGSTDLHSENLIAHRVSPILVDLETLLAGALPKRGQYESGLSDSLMYSHLLPNWALDGDDNRDIGALTGEGKNQLVYNDKLCPAYEHTGEILQGFTETYDFILAHREQIEHALHMFDRAQFRKLLRPTEVYGRLCDQLLHPRYLADEQTRRKCAEKLRRAYERDADPEWAKKMERVCESEIDAVLRGDIPYFFSYGNERSLRDWKGAVCDDYFALSPVENAVKRLYMMNETDKRDQMKIIEQSLNTVNPNIESTPVTTPKQVYELLESRALETNPCSWIGIDTDDKGRAYLQSIGFDLYNGLLGVLCFYAALFDATGHAQAKHTIEKRYAPYRAMYIKKQTPLAARADNINLTHGVGGHIMALSYMARCLKDDSYINDAITLISRFDLSQYNDFEHMDIFGGISGLFIALPPLMGYGIDDKLKEIATLLAEPLCKDAPKLTGCGHGAAGEALALACAQTILSERRYESDILRILRAENETYDKAEHNWPDLRSEEKQGFMHGICAGAPGIAVARAKMLHQNIGDEVRAICDADIARIREYYASPRAPLKRDSFCCGNAARIEGERLLFGEVNNSSLNEFPAFFHPLDSNDFPAGLFQGWAGAGYALTRSLPTSKTGLFD